MPGVSARVAVYDDVHGEFESTRDGARRADAWLPPPNLNVDAILLLGDIETDAGRFSQFVRQIRQSQRDETAIVAIPGNHETYGNNFRTYVDEFRSAIANVPNAHYLERSAVELPCGVRLLGATLWTDATGLDDISVRMNDYRLGRVGERWLLPTDTTSVHKETVAWLERELGAGDRARTIVMTHHAPSVLSNTTAIGERKPLPYVAEDMSLMYCNNLESLIERSGPALWVHGHVHRSVDYRIEKTRVMSNPRGYFHPKVEHDDQNPGFRSQFIVQLDVSPDNRVRITTDHGPTLKELAKPRGVAVEVDR